MLITQDIRNHFIAELAAEHFTIDRNGSKTIEMIGASFLADANCIFGFPNVDYIKAEIEWYTRAIPNVNIFKELYEIVPKAWISTGDPFGAVNSNYGELVYSPKYHRQFVRACDELIQNPDSRRAQMVYNRPSIWTEYNEGGKNDFICTNAQTMYIRDGKLHMVCQMRSNDALWGYANDYAWAKHLMSEAVKVINHVTEAEIPIEIGDLHWQVMNLHVYFRHFDLVKQHM